MILLQNGPNFILWRMSKKKQKQIITSIVPMKKIVKGKETFYESLQSLCFTLKQLILNDSYLAYVPEKGHDPERIRTSPPNFQPGVPLLDLATIQDFFRLYVDRKALHKLSQILRNLSMTIPPSF